MSEEILKALMELFALVVKQDGGILEDEREYVLNFLDKQLNTNTLIKYVLLFDELTGPVNQLTDNPDNTSPSVRDSVKILNICKQINKTLNKGQKVVVLIHLYELANASKRFTPQRLNIISIVAEVFKILPDELSAIDQYIRNNDADQLRNPSILVLSPGKSKCEICNRIHEADIETTIVILRIASVDLYFLKYFSEDQLYLNGLPIEPRQIYSFAEGGVLRARQSHPFYYSDINSKFISTSISQRLYFSVNNVSYRLRSKQKILANMSFAVEQVNLVGILGASGSGKTTLLNVMSGIVKPSTGSVSLNGFDLFRDKKDLEGIIGFVPQDDLLIEDLSVFENLYFATCQCFGNRPKKENVNAAEQMLSSLGLFDKRDMKVGNPLNKTISGGERKRLNIALELIREPSVLFIDEPTSGLSSKDSENIMVLLRDLTLKGKLVFVVIHQPSSDIFKMFDKVLILDQGGYMAYFGYPVDSIIYFKTLASQINSSLGECPSCGNVNPEIIFKILETQVVDEFGNYTEKRKTKPKEWSEKFKSQQPLIKGPEVTGVLQKYLRRPGWLKQFALFLSRDFLSKKSNLQYVLLTLLEAPVLAFILSFIIRYIPDPDSRTYLFSENENIPIYIFMNIIVALFLGLTISAEEIFNDRKILKREQFLNLSRSSYLIAKIVLLLCISAFQSFLFILVGNSILEIRFLFFRYWLAFFATAFCANMIGLIISCSFNSVITIYIIIPLLIIPMMVLSGAMFSFDKLNRNITRADKVPVIAEIMPTRWTYEAVMVSQFKDNIYSSLKYNSSGDTYYSVQKKISQAEFNTVYRIPGILRVLQETVSEYGTTSPDRDKIIHNLRLIRNEVHYLEKLKVVPVFEYTENINADKFTVDMVDPLSAYLTKLNSYFAAVSDSASHLKDKFFNLNEAKLRQLEKRNYNYKLEEIVTKYYETDKILRYKDSFVQNTDPVYLDPVKRGVFAFRTHFFAPSKYFLGHKVDTFIFNISMIFAGVIFFYLILYYDMTSRIVNFFQKLKSRK